MKTNHRIGYLVALATIALSAIGVGIAYANPSAFGPITQSSVATSSPVFMTPGTATSTITYDSLVGSKTQQYKANSVGLAIQYTGSSTNSVLNVTPEYSQDGVDWYSGSIIDPNGITATSSPINLAFQNNLTMKFASSTVGGLGITLANSGIETRFVVIPTPARYTRVVFSETAANGAVWGEFVPVKEVY